MKKLMAIVVSAFCAAVAFGSVSTVTELKEALAAANDGGVIEVAAGTYEISEELVLSGHSDVTLKGAGKSATVFVPAKDGDGAAIDTRLLHVTDCPNFTLQGIGFKGVRRQIAAEGGAVRIENTSKQAVLIVDCAFVDNRIDAATGVAKGAGLSTYNCSFGVTGCDFISNVVYSGDNAAAGGAWDNSGTTGPLGLVNCVFDSNGSLGYTSSGAGAFNTVDYTSDTFNNLLIVRNYSYVHKWADSGATTKPTAGAFANVGGTFYNCTIAHNTSPAIYRPSSGVGEIYYKDTIMWANGRYSITDARHQTNTILEPTIYVNIDTSARSTEDPKFVNDYHLASDSPAIDAGSRTAEAAGLADRTVFADGTLDTGAVDLGYHYIEGISASAQEIYVDSAAAAEGDGSEGAPYKTLTEALKHATNDSTIHLASGTYDRASGETFPIAPADILRLTIVCEGDDPAVFDNGGVAGARVFDFVGCHGVTLGNLVVKGGNVTATDTQSGSFIEGGGIRSYNSVDIRLKDVSVESNVAGGSTTDKAVGGGVSVRGGSLIAERSSFGGNTAKMGGGLFVYNGILHVWDSFVTNNTANSSGSGVYMAPIDNSSTSTTLAYDAVGCCDLRNVLLTGQSGSSVIYARAGRLGIFSCTVAGNNCISWGRDGSGGPTSFVYDSIFVQNGSESSVSFSSGANGSNILPGTDPKFESGFYLKDGSPAIDAGHTDVASWSTPNVINQGLRSWFVTKVDGTADTGTLDIGFHYPAGLVRETHLYFVDPVNGNDTNDGLTEGAALKTVTAAFAKVGDGDSVALMPGTYSVASGETFPLALEGKADVSVFPTNATSVTFDATGSAHRVLTLKDCANPSFRDIVFTGGESHTNEAVAAGTSLVCGGGGAAVVGGSGLALQRCMFVGNVTTCAVDEVAVMMGGGLLLHDVTSATLEDVTVRDNAAVNVRTTGSSVAGACGGGIASVSSSLTMQGGRVLGNFVDNRNPLRSAYMNGSGVYVGHGSFDVRNALFALNGGGSVLYSSWDPNGTVKDDNSAGKINAYFCTISENGSAAIGTRNGYMAQKFYSCALSGNGRSETNPEGLPETDTRPIWDNCLIPVGTTGLRQDNGCILTDVTGIKVRSDGSCKIQGVSPVVDAALNTYPWLTVEGAVDNNGNPRIVGIKDKKTPIPDIGCVELQAIPGLMLIVR